MTNQYYDEMLNTYIPWGSSTCSKHAGLTPEEPAVLVSGKGCRVKDADGKEYIDFKNGLGPISLGYNYEPVNAAIRAQLDNGIIFSYPSPLEAEVAKAITEIIPCAEQARFLKTGGEACAACIKGARFITGHDHVIQCGYNGWLNSLATDAMALPGRKGTSGKTGIPMGFASLYHTTPWNNIEKLEELGKEYGDNLAAVIISADYNRMDDARTFYPYLREFTNRYGAALIFDEIVTGFRIALGGVQEHYGVTPDMAVFAKAIANGMPLSVYCGTAKWMKAFAPGGAVVSSTYGGETLSLAAAKKVIEIYRTEDVIGHLWRMGARMWGGLDKIAKEHDLPIQMGMTDRPVGFYSPRAGEHDRYVKMERAILKAGVTLYHGGYVNYSHQEADIDEALERIEGAVKNL